MVLKKEKYKFRLNWYYCTGSAEELEFQPKVLRWGLADLANFQEKEL